MPLLASTRMGESLNVAQEYSATLALALIPLAALAFDLDSRLSLRSCCLSSANDSVAVSISTSKRDWSISTGLCKNCSGIANLDLRFGFGVVLGCSELEVFDTDPPSDAVTASLNNPSRHMRSPSFSTGPEIFDFKVADTDS